MDDEFYILAKDMEQERIKLNTDSFKRDVLAVWADFICWCRSQGYEPVESHWKPYIKAEKKVINFWIRKKIFEDKFGYTFTFDSTKRKWESKKNA